VMSLCCSFLRKYATMPWSSPASDSSSYHTWEHDGIWMQCYLMPYPPSHLRGANSRGGCILQIDMISAQPIRTPPIRSETAACTDRTGLTRGQLIFLLRDRNIVSRRKKKRFSPCRLIQNDVQIGDVKVVVKDLSKRPIAFDKLVNPSAQRPIMANDHEASSSSPADKYHQPRWCPLGLTRT